MSVLRDIITRVQFKCDDPDATYITSDYVLGFAQDVYEWLYNKLRLTDYQFDEQIIILPAVPAGTPDLVTFQQPSGPLEQLVQPRMVRWRLPGQDATYWIIADGPLDEVRDVAAAGLPVLDSWAWTRYILRLSNFSTALDLEITGNFLFDPLTATDSPLEISQTANRVLSCKLASEVGKAKGNDKWMNSYSADADDALDDLMIEITKADQGKTHRVGRMSRRQSNTTRLSAGR